MENKDIIVDRNMNCDIFKDTFNEKIINISSGSFDEPKGCYKTAISTRSMKNTELFRFLGELEPEDMSNSYVLILSLKIETKECNYIANIIEKIDKIVAIMNKDPKTNKNKLECGLKTEMLYLKTIYHDFSYINNLSVSEKIEYIAKNFTIENENLASTDTIYLLVNKKMDLSERCGLCHLLNQYFESFGKQNRYLYILMENITQKKPKKIVDFISEKKDDIHISFFIFNFKNLVYDLNTKSNVKKPTFSYNKKFHSILMCSYWEDKKPKTRFLYIGFEILLNNMTRPKKIYEIEIKENNTSHISKENPIIFKHRVNLVFFYDYLVECSYISYDEKNPAIRIKMLDFLSLKWF
ncbi:hypothetical protein CWI38_1080p0010 [Hamiltosporidium tvaerminnensis]|uniref:Uncharacterized protein n=4 Tax=Hamiltosporidium TaxID=1176354 RepID=A0A4Q9LV78_9MICR|nr:hypothetical protein CWI37_0399p0010 [Hamiltosporidium tvaerminnensis]TBU07918.1 hypothetical protein CWI39_0251p0010 [Hamiltosporidium magnivora]TBU11691.1 hypothetical protein CWI38_1080p0010 [Hamiltosporidium tvaerminnensis]